MTASEREELAKQVERIPCETIVPVTEYQEALRDGFLDGHRGAIAAAAALIRNGGDLCRALCVDLTEPVADAGTLPH